MFEVFAKGKKVNFGILAYLRAGNVGKLATLGVVAVICVDRS